MLVSCMRLDNSALRNQCARSSDCNPGRICVGGTCQASASDARLDVADSDGPVGEGLGADGLPGDGSGNDRPTGDGFASEGRGNSEVGSGESVIDPVADGPPGYDLGDGGPAAQGVPTDAGVQPPDPCLPGSADGPRTAGADLSRAIIGSWRVCKGNDPSPDLSWLLGDATTIQIGANRWWRIPEGQAAANPQSPAGLYFRILEGSGNVFHFVDINLNSGAGADLSIELSSRSRTIDLIACDGVVRCPGPPIRLVPAVSPSGG